MRGKSREQKHIQKRFHKEVRNERKKKREFIAAQGSGMKPKKPKRKSLNPREDNHNHLWRKEKA